MNKNPCVCILWNDAAYTNDKKVLSSVPPPQLTCGFVIDENKEYINLSVNSYYVKGKKVIQPIDGFIIPIGSIINFKKMNFYDKK